MEFWGIEIKPGSSFKVKQEDGYIIHVTQIALGEGNKMKDETVPIYVTVPDEKKTKLVLGTVSKKIPQVPLDLYFEQDFELSHNCKTASVFIIGYKTREQDEEIGSDFDSEEEGYPVDIGLEKRRALLGGDVSDSDSEDSSDDDEEEVKEVPLKVEPPSKKRPNGGAINKNAVASKKAKVVADQKKPTCGKQGKKCC